MAARNGEAMRQRACELPVRLISWARLPAFSVLMLALLLSVRIEPASGCFADALRVRLEAVPGPYYEGQGIALAVLVVGRDQRPSIELPRLSHAEVWTAGTSFKPINATGVGPVESGENLYITRLRIVPRRSGPLQIPPILARINDQSGRSGSLRLTVEPVPFEGRPAEFLGGVGAFSVQASVLPTTVRVGQEFIYRIRLTGPAAWGTTSRPDLSRFDRIPLAFRVERLPDERTGEPPSVTFVYRIRPTRAGKSVLPPVAIAAFDPGSPRYLTRVTRGVPIEAVAVPAFDPRTIDYVAPDLARNRRLATAWASAATLLIIGLGAAGLAIFVQRRRLRTSRSGPAAARRLARQVLRDLNKTPRERSAHDPREDPRQSGWFQHARTSPRMFEAAARKITDGLIAYARAGMGRPPGAITPDEARQAVVCSSDSQELGDQAAELLERCDQALFAARPHGCDTLALLETARGLFAALGQVSIARKSGVSESQARASE